MKSLQVILLLSVLGFVHCASGNKSRRTIYTFDHDGVQYEIVSTSLSNGDGYNVLVCRHADAIVFSAKDINQDGRLDTKITGEITLEQANRIYETGILKAKSQGKFSSKTESEIYQISDNSYNYYLETFYSHSRIHNKFTVFDKTNQTEIILVDQNADGTLDGFEKGSNNLQRYNEMYRFVIAQGNKANAVVKQHHMYVVKTIR